MLKRICCIATPVSVRPPLIIHRCDETFKALPVVGPTGIFESRLGPRIALDPLDVQSHRMSDLDGWQASSTDSDREDSTDSVGAELSDDDTVSPRLRLI